MFTKRSKKQGRLDAEGQNRQGAHEHDEPDCEAEEEKAEHYQIDAKGGY
jgi:hypothetical protein